MLTPTQPVGVKCSSSTCDPCSNVRRTCVRARSDDQGNWDPEGKPMAQPTNVIESGKVNGKSGRRHDGRADHSEPSLAADLSGLTGNGRPHPSHSDSMKTRNGQEPRLESSAGVEGRRPKQTTERSSRNGSRPDHGPVHAETGAARTQAAAKARRKGVSASRRGMAVRR